jgi:hypothetical protein
MSVAFELLPEKASEVAHVYTSHDLESRLSQWLEGGKIKTGVAIDTRPFAMLSGSLKDYPKGFNRLAYSTVLAIGTAKETAGGNDIVTAVGLKIPLLDRGDPRLDQALQDKLNSEFGRAFPDIDRFPESDDIAAVQKKAEEAWERKSIQDAIVRFRRDHRFDGRIDVGLAGSVTSSEDGGSFQRRSGGVWLAGAVPLWKSGQLCGSGKTIWVRVDADTLETARTVLGVRLRLFPSELFSLSAEAAHSWSAYGRQVALDEEWNHYGILGELYVKTLKGWIGVGYGGDTRHRSAPDNEVALHYAFYRERILDPNK